MPSEAEDATRRRVQFQEPIRRSSEMEGAPSASDSGVDEGLADQQAPSNASNSSGNANNNGGGGSGGGSTGQSRSRVTVVCQECKRLKLKCDRKFPCASCLKRNTVERCLYSAAAAEKVDMHSLNNRLTEMEAIMGAYCRGIPIDFTPTYPPAIQAMEDRVAAYPAQGGGLVNPAPQAAVAVQPSDHHRHHHHDAASAADTQPFFLSGPLDIARSYGCALCEDAGEVVEGICRCGEECEEELRVKEEPTSEHEDEDEIMRSTGSSAMSGISIVASSTSKSKGKGRALQQAHPSSDSPAQRNSAQALLPAVSVYYTEHALSASPTMPLGLPVSNPNPPTSFPTPEAAPLFYASGPDPLQAPQSQALATFTTSGLSVAATPMASPSAAAPMAPPPPPVRGFQEIASKASVTLALIAQLPETETGLQLLKNAMNALNCFILDLGLPHTPGGRVVGWNALFKRFQKRLARRGLSGAPLAGSSKSTSHALAPRPKEKSSSSRKKSVPASSYDAVQSSSVYYSGSGKSRPSTHREGTPSSARLGHVRAGRGVSPSPSSPSSPRSSVQPSAPVPVSSRSRKSRARDDVSVASSTDLPAQTESLPYFALNVAIMAVGALNSPPVRGVRTDSTNKFGTVDHSESPSFLYALSQQALNVWMEGEQPLPVGVKDEQASTKDMRADFLRASLVGLHYLMANTTVASPIRFCTQSRKHPGPGRQDVLSLMGKMVTAMRNWDFAEGLLSPSVLKAEERAEAPSGPATSSRKASSSRSKRGKSGQVQSAEPSGSAGPQKEEDVRREKEESRIRVLWDFYFYDFILSDALGEQSLIPASCYSIPLPSLPPDANTSERASDSRRMDEDDRTSSKDQDKAKDEIQRIRLEHVFLVQRASLTRLACTIKRNLSSPDCCCGHTLEQAVKMENSIKEWMDGVPAELRWAFKHGVESTPSELVAIGRTPLEDDGSESEQPRAEGLARRRVLSGELALMSQLILFKIFSPFVFEYLAKGGPVPEPQSSIATALRRLQAPAQAIIRISKLVHDVWEFAAQSNRGTFHTPPSLKPPLLELYPLGQLVLDATLVCSRICCGFVPDDPEADNPGMDRCDPCSSEMMLSIGMGLTLLENLHGTPQRGQSGRSSSSSIRSPSSVDVKLVELLRRRWEAKNALLAPLEPLKRDRSTMEREDREGEDGDVEIDEEGPSGVRMRRIDSPSDSGREDSIRAEMQERSVPVNVTVDRTENTRHDSTSAGSDYAAIVPRHPAPPARLTTKPATAAPPPPVPSLLATVKAKKVKDKDKEKEKEKKKAKPVIRVRAEGGTAQKVESMKPPPNPPFTRQPLPAKRGKTPGSAESPRNEFQPPVGGPRYTPPTAMHPSPVHLIHPEVAKTEYDNSAMGGPISSLAHPPMTHLPSNTQYGSGMNEPGSRGSYPASYSSTDAMMNMAPSHYQGETHGLESSYATPHVDAYHHARHPYPPPPPTPVYGPPSHPPTPLSANPARSADYFGQQVDTQSSSSVYYVDQAGYEPMRQQAPTNLQPYELSNQMPYGSAMSGHPESTTVWSQPPEDMQNHQTHEQSYSWPPQHQHQQSASW